MALFTESSVLVRTEEGESAARQPRRVASNRARAALLLLDGQLSVGEMKRRFGESLEVVPGKTNQSAEELTKFMQTAVQSQIDALNSQSSTRSST